MKFVSHFLALCFATGAPGHPPLRLHNPIVQNLHLPTRIAIKEMMTTTMTMRTLMTVAKMMMILEVLWIPTTMKYSIVVVVKKKFQPFL